MQEEREVNDMYMLLRMVLLAIFLSLPLVSSGMDSMPTNLITVRFDLKRHMLRGVSRISLPEGRPSEVDLSGIRILSATVNGAPLKTEPGASVITFGPAKSAYTVEVEYELDLTTAPMTDTQKNPGVVHGNFLDESGAVFLDGWYPSVRGLSVYRLTALLPEGFEGISEADDVTVRPAEKGGREFSFSFPHPVRGITFVAGKYSVEKEVFNGTEIVAYFLPEDVGLSKSYVEYTKKYLGMYEKLIGKYRYKRFAVVENVLPTGYSMPTYTLLGRDVVRLPFIVETSLGHEILHQWFGNMVYVGDSGGNWSEGLTTCLADQRYEELKGNGPEYRKQIMISFQSFVTPQNDFPLGSFSSRTDYASRSIGYGKAAMVFHMLRDLTGEKVFYEAIRAFVEKNSFRPASWGDIRTAFEAATGKDLTWYFKQWLTEKGAPELEVKNAVLSFRGSKAIVSFDLEQKGGDYRLHVPVMVKTKEGEIRKTFDVEKKKTALQIETEGSPVELVVDDQYDIFRRLPAAEFPPVISRLLGDGNKIFVVPEGEEERYASASAYLKGEGFVQKKPVEMTYGEIRGSSILIFGSDSGLARSLFGSARTPKEDFSLAVRENPYNVDRVIAIVDCASPAETAAYLRRMTHYGKYSRISFRDGKNTLKETAGSRQGINVKISEEVPGVEIRRLINIPDIIEKVSGKKIVYVGEVHDRFEHHRVQLEVIRALHKRNGKIAIGMEMFQKPFQQALDDYIAGTIDERSFLKKSEYFKRWGFDYTLYREILLYARENKIPVLALNIRKEIVTKVAKEGLYSLSAEERKEIPGDMDLSDIEYKTRLKEFFERHGNPESKNFDFFYEAQVLWDESMAHNLNAFMQVNPEYQTVVVAGMGHLMFGSGIPKRAYRLNGGEYSVILNDGDIEKNLSDFILYPTPIRPPQTPKLMVVLKEEGGKVSIQDFAGDSIAEKAGLKKGDIILAMDDTTIESMDDIKIFLLYKKKGDTIAIKVLRDRFLLGPAGKIYTVTF